GSQEGCREHQERSRLQRPAPRCEALRWPGRQRRRDHRPSARHPLPPGHRCGPWRRRHALRPDGRCGPVRHPPRPQGRQHRPRRV
ncbi:MAG: LSU ribosomal protein L27p, partial [uncultured Nocardioides sp.]